jgi:hypothetical protein
VASIHLVPKKIGIKLEEIQNDTYENARIYKEKTKSLRLLLFFLLVSCIQQGSGNEEDSSLRM